MSATQELEQELSALKRDGLLNPAGVVEWAAANPESALHRQFEWNDTAAAAQWRLDQARNG
jgi:hypothetical protein